MHGEWWGLSAEVYALATAGQQTDRSTTTDYVFYSSGFYVPLYSGFVATEPWVQRRRILWKPLRGEQCSGAKGHTMPEGSTAFSCLEAYPRSKEGINGSLTPARRQRRLSFENNPASSQKTTNNKRCDDDCTGARNPLPERKGSPEYERLASSGDRLDAGGEGISLQETQARIQELERSEFDLKMRLFYTEEQLENAAGRADAVQLHREVADAKRVGFQLALTPPSPHPSILW